MTLFQHLTAAQDLMMELLPCLPTLQAEDQVELKTLLFRQLGPEHAPIL